MKTLILAGAGLAGSVLAASLGVTSAMAATQPPMNSFNDAYYTCDNDGAFLMSYDSDKPKSATMTTSNNSKKYMLKRASVSSGVQFAGDNAKFWTDGKTVTVDGTDVPLQNCKLKGS